MRYVCKYPILILLFSLSFLACTPQEGEEVEIQTDGIFEPVTYVIEGGVERGEFLTGGQGDLITVSVKNNSEFSLKGLELVLDEDSTARVKFNPDSEGKSKSPGVDGTCGLELKPQRTCVYKIFFKPTISGSLSQKITFKYKNLVEENSFSDELNFLSGEAASLVFTNDTINYDFGLIERTDATFDTVYDLTIRNAGELTAKNVVYRKDDLPRANPLPGTEAVQVLVNDCPTELKKNETCRLKVGFKPQNYSAAAPDGDVFPIDYLTTLSFTYGKDPEGGKGTLKSYYRAKSTKIAGDIVSGGIVDIDYDNPLVAGNHATKVVKMVNRGYKEAVIHRIDIRDPSNAVIASCVNDGGGAALSCRNPADINNPTKVPLSTLPFEVFDNSGCLNPLSKNNYTRLGDGSLSDPTITTITGKTLTSQGGSCFFDIKFWPSMANLNDGDYNDWDLAFVYDTTWKNTINMVGDASDLRPAEDKTSLVIRKAEFYAAARLDDFNLNYADVNYAPTSIDTSTPNVKRVYFNIGRVALVQNTSGIDSLSPYARTMRLEMRKNAGFASAKVQTILHGDGTDVPVIYAPTDQQVYQNYYHSFVKDDTCAEVLSAGYCRFSGKFSPVASNLSGADFENEVSASTYDDLSGTQKKFVTTYTDGSSINDDGSARVAQTVEIYVRVFPIRQGYLIIAGNHNENIDFTAGDEVYHFLELRNVGTGPIPYIRMASSSFGINYPANNVNVYPFEYVTSPKSGYLGSALNCLDLGVDTTYSAPVGVPNPAETLPAGSSCRLVVKGKLRDGDVVTTFVTEDTTDKWNRLFQVDLPGGDDLELHQPISANSSISFSFFYMDGDGVADAPNGYFPEYANFGNQKTAYNASIPFRFNFNTKSEGILVPIGISPENFATFWRQAINYPSIPPGGPVGHQTNNFGGYIQPEIFLDYATILDNPFDSTVYKVPNTINLLQGDRGAYLDASSSEYTYYGGVYQANEGPFETEIRLGNRGEQPIDFISANWVAGGDSEIDLKDPLDTSLQLTSSVDDQRSLVFTFNPTLNAEITYSRILEIQYRNGRQDVDNSNPSFYLFNPRVVKMRIRVVFDSVEQNKSGPTFEFSEYFVAHDKSTKIETGESLTTGWTTINTGVNKYPSNSADRGTVEFIKNSEDSRGRGKIRITNNGNSTMYDLQTFLAESPTRIITDNGVNDPATSVFWKHSDTCSGNNLAPTQSCIFEVDFSPKLSTSGYTYKSAVVNYSYSPGGDKYTSRIMRLLLRAKDPAELEIAGKTETPARFCTLANPSCSESLLADKQLPNCLSNTLEGCQPIGQSRMSYKFNLGSFAQAYHPVYDISNKTLTISNVHVRNTSTERASLLAQYRIHEGDKGTPSHETIDILSGEWHRIYDKAKIQIDANRACFHGDQVGTPDEWGFNNTSGGNCLLNITYFFGENEIPTLNDPSKLIDEELSHVRLVYYNNKRSSTSRMYLHFAGYLEMDRSTYSGTDLSNVSVDSTGAASFSWDDFNVDNAAIGPIVGYRVFYTNSGADLNGDLIGYTTGFVDSATKDVNIYGLQPGSYYKIKIIPKRQLGNGEITLSRDVSTSPFEIVVPENGAYYDYEKKVVFDGYLSPFGVNSIGDKDSSKLVCDNEVSTYVKDGSPVNIFKKLVTEEVFGLLNNSNSNYIYDSYPHWLADPPRDVTGFFETIDCSANIGANNANDTFFSKTCGDCSCMDLSTMRGGDGVDLPPGSTVFIDGENGVGVARCFFNQ